MTVSPPTFSDVLDAARLLQGRAVVTPLLNAPLLDARLGGRLFVKAEPLQKTGSFKFRGAYNAIARLSAEQRRRGVVAFSSGNHAQGMARAAAELSAPCVIVMPRDAPSIKVARTRAFGAEVVLYDRHGEDREAIGRRLSAERGLALIPPYDHPHVIAGQGTCGNELADQCLAAGIVPDAVLVPASGGGLVAGVSLAVARKLAGTKVYVCEPEGYDDHRRSLEAGRRVEVKPNAPSICDALLQPIPGEITFAINGRALAGGFAPPEREVRRAMAAAFAEFKLVVEPGGAVALAAVLSGAFDVRGKTAVVVCSGGNVDPALFAAVLAEHGVGAKE